MGRGRQFSRLLASEVCASAEVMLDTPCSEVVWRVLATHSIRQFPLHFPSRASPCAITFQLDSYNPTVTLPVPGLTTTMSYLFRTRILYLLILPQNWVAMILFNPMQSKRLFGVFENLRKATITFGMSICPHGTSRLPLDGFLWNLIFEYFFENLSTKLKFY
jgi:hypothetical protein